MYTCISIINDLSKKKKIKYFKKIYNIINSSDNNEYTLICYKNWLVKHQLTDINIII